ncbi:PAP/OAS1 substrate-binding domain-containing protein [Westerdykella ornata]|uniref:polynucleotide adenylyltransferase n=1 Tax=Westerdykella ornata TaxID=318751 RepID=A0A6A6JTS8_WESOR|nr:PAP/OAS1 substrate-binding domain-containing protein [Westerdykella ornata]KAF2280030.1 PAP/OAS1 substrate-binding domain-containing protein [Westerdykella ornata]
MDPALQSGSLEDQVRRMILSHDPTPQSPTGQTTLRGGQQQGVPSPNPRPSGQAPTHPRYPHPGQRNRRNFGRNGAQIPPNPQQAPQSMPPRILPRPQQLSNTDTRSPASSPRTAQFTRQNGLQAMYQRRPEQIPENPLAQIQFLDYVASQEVPRVEISIAELEEKESFRILLERILRDAISKSEACSDLETIDLVGFGSLASGFATPGSDMDLAVVPIWREGIVGEHASLPKDVPRLLEKAILDSRMGGRLLSKTRVPILKVCQIPSEELFTALYEERKKWDELPEEKKYPQPAPPKPAALVDLDDGKSPETMDQRDPSEIFAAMDINDLLPKSADRSRSPSPKQSVPEEPASQPENGSTNAKPTKGNNNPHKPRDRGRFWVREKPAGPLDFPKTGIGIQCDINFSNSLGLHNTHLLRCYSLTDPRVRPMVLFVKSWAKRRKINNSYSGTLSSYGWVLMVLHYLVNIAQPPVCPNLQLSWRPGPTSADSLGQMLAGTTVDGYTVRFWRNEQEILEAARQGRLTRNTQSLGALLRGFFQYFAALPAYNPGYISGPRAPSFYWTTEVLSLRTPGGILTKQEKGWTGAKTTTVEGKEVRSRYLFAIEDPFELDHNVARTVTHNGIVAIRDEFRRAWRILVDVGRGLAPAEGGLFDEVVQPVKASEKEKEVEKGVGVAEAQGLVMDEQAFPPLPGVKNVPGEK